MTVGTGIFLGMLSLAVLGAVVFLFGVRPMFKELMAERLKDEKELREEGERIRKAIRSR